MQKPGESTEEYRLALEEDVGHFQNQIFDMIGQRPTAFTYPYGFISKSSTEILKSMGFRASLSCAEGINYITRDPDCLYRLKRVNRTPDKTSEEFFRVLAPPREKEK